MTKKDSPLCASALSAFAAMCVFALPAGLSAEDCLPYDPTGLKIVDEGERGWLLTDGRLQMFILDNEEDAEQALALAKRHTKQCFIGRDNKRSNRKDYIVTYWSGDSGIKTNLGKGDYLPYDPGSRAPLPADSGDRAPNATADTGGQFLEKARNDCVRKGWVYTDLGSGGGRCDPPQAAPPTRAPQAEQVPGEKGAERAAQGIGQDWATQQRCRRYAEDAVSDYHDNMRMDCNFGGAQWQENNDAHYQWCLKVPRDAELSAARARSAQLQQCRKARERRFD